MKFGSEIAKARKRADLAMQRAIAEEFSMGGVSNAQFSPSEADWKSGPVGMSTLHSDGYTKDIGQLPPGVSE